MQASLFDEIALSCTDLPSHARMPVNLSARKIYSVLMPDLCRPGAALVITGYSGLDQLIQLINQRGAREKPLRLILGSDPVSAKRTGLSPKRYDGVACSGTLIIETDFSHVMNSLNRLAS
ncbi:hypothetical protein [Stutzerimonas nosocomialis]|uniref:hypothetical protein n=1 Tax=Stutzerimonas nosocomialis TaxID=1056496 RepID=UPI0011090F24|nr:hypothetical protein [Stutzerimonas nosocomialis]